MPFAPLPSHRTGRFSTGLTGWYGVWQPRSLLEPSAREGPSARLCLEAISSVSQAPLHPSSSWAITGWDCRCTESWTGDLYQAIISIFETMPLAKAGLVLLAITMIAFYATSFDALTMVASSYSYKSLGAEEEPHKQVKLFWAILLMLLPIALIFAENSMANLQTVSIIAAFPIGFIIVLIVWGFFKDARHYLDKENSGTRNIE